MGQSAQSQASLYWQRRQRLARLILQDLVPYTAGLNLEPGDIVSAYSGTAAYAAGGAGTTTGSIPTGVEPPLSFNDGAVGFVKVSTLELARTLYGGDL